MFLNSNLVVWVVPHIPKYPLKPPFNTTLSSKLYRGRVLKTHEQDARAICATGSAREGCGIKAWILL
jgi:hypothetical protein